MISSVRTGTVSRRVGLILINQISSGTFSAPTLLGRMSSCTGGLSENRPSQKISSPICTAGKIVGTAQEASTCSSRIGSRFDMKPLSAGGTQIPAIIGSPRQRVLHDARARCPLEGLENGDVAGPLVAGETF